MNPNESSRAPALTSTSHRAYVALLIVVAGLALLVAGVTGFFRLGTETTALRGALMSSVPGTWQKKIALRVGGFTTGAVRAGSRLFPLQPAPRAALETLRGGEVGVYRLRESPSRIDYASILARADHAMSARGWDRIVGVAQERQLVTVYCPHEVGSPRRLQCCVMVFDGHDLVVAAARGSLEPLWNLAATQPELSRIFPPMTKPW